MLKQFNTCILLICCSIFNTYAQSKLTDEQILARINNCRPLLGAPIDRNIKNRLGATHVDGKYYLSKEPFLVEGASKLNDLGFGVLKVWFRKNGEGYTYHSNWNLAPNIQLAELAQHPYWKTTFTYPFSTFVLSLDGAGITTTDSSAKAEEEEIFRLVTYLLTTYKNRKLTFILQNWEGDWILRGGNGDSANWSRTPGIRIPSAEGNMYSVAVPKDSLARINALTKWFSARQRGVERARKAVPHSRTTVYHAIEANRVIDCMNGLPGIANQ
ncbi:MAG: hypothetical protein MUE38_06490, partial [Flavihumibacter sp.]|nr:hypothetical protein [Flavihumibacter sp.]